MLHVRGLALAGCLLSLGGCAHVGRDGATSLSQAGVRATTTLAADVDARVARLRADRAAQDFVAAYNVMPKCATVTHGAGTDPNCDALLFSKGRAGNPVNQQIGKLGDVVAKRATALRALGSAYAALGEEAAYDQPAAIDAAIAPALDAVNAYAGAVGVAPLSGIASGSIKLIGHALAANAQKQRLIRDSRQIAPLTAKMRAALTRERDLFGQLDSLLADLDQETRAAMLRANIVDAQMAVRTIARGAGVPLSDSALASAIAADPALRGAAEAAVLDALPAASSGDLDCGIALLADLETQHAKFEKGEPLQMSRIAADIDKLAAVIGPPQQ